jgi:hypothetical protein
MSDYNVDAVRELAARYVDQFEPLERTENFSTYKRKDDADPKLEELCRVAHGDMMPDDYVYNYIVEVFSFIANSSTDKLQFLFSLESDIYNFDLLKWLSSNLNRANYVNSYVKEFGIEPKDFDLYEVIAGGQIEEKREIFNSVLSSLIKLSNEMEDEHNNDV